MAVVRSLSRISYLPFRRLCKRLWCLQRVTETT